MVIGLLSVELHIPHSQSLKDKRMVLRSIKDRVKKFNVAVAEVAHQDVWQRAGLGIVAISTTTEPVDKELAALSAVTSEAVAQEARSASEGPRVVARRLGTAQ